MNPPSTMSVFLVGMMGAGKTTIGGRLACRLNRPFIDVDRELEARLGVDIPTIFDVEGEAGFRRRESLLIDELSRLPDRVMATGGGAVLAECNRACLMARGRVIYLRATPGELWQRLRRDRHRPLLQSSDLRERIRSLHEARHPLYESVADYAIDTGCQPVDATVELIAGWLARTEESFTRESACTRST